MKYLTLMSFKDIFKSNFLETVNAVTAVTADDDAPHKDAGSAVILYYADKGEHVWDISKRFSSRPSDILSENSLEDEVLSGDVMLLIPTA